jgi:hypothetical protein
VTFVNWVMIFALFALCSVFPCVSAAWAGTAAYRNADGVIGQAGLFSSRGFAQQLTLLFPVLINILMLSNSPQGRASEMPSRWHRRAALV